ncbi:hypothetical protein MJO28_015766 [Puccinia striiformis f. sp. tritici]|uniref:Uncharacterized protein n=1 Tax=Puccinia striiformis f. sp. tritici TaxID=168172 RepID=A0ACC0DQR2_9BASI|nr:hypothetical protein Pst134EB_029920 [Puccinia striiformis f. sp. tritici]KAI7936322.1 hypothetical protein MJO29_015625 [Puccinia striiformis f. sp. tritici]KAI7936867.1 hypothetical protein MJO28_015766 [Puccinia striiformis f. sp. tritici]
MKEDDHEHDTVTDLLALRLSSVPFHDVAPHDHVGSTSKGDRSTNEVTQEGESIVPDRWVPQLATISFVGPIFAIHPSNGIFSAHIPLLSLDSHITSLTLIVLPDTLVVGKLPDDTLVNCANPPSNWLISGEICMISDELAIVAQSLYSQGEEMQGNEIRMSQAIFTGYISTIVPSDRVGWIYSNIKKTYETREESMTVANNPEAWHCAEVCSQVRVTLADVEWLDVSVELGVKSSSNPIGWVHARNHLVSFKCRPSKSNLDHSRVLHYATTLPLVGQLIAIQPATIDSMLTFFIQL